MLWHTVRLRGSRSLVEWRMCRRARNPTTFNQLLHVKMLRDRRPILTSTADKVLVRDFITSHAGANYVVPLLTVGRSSDDIDWFSLPREFVAKVNHGSGGCVIVTDDALPGARLPEVGSATEWTLHRVRPSQAPPANIGALLDGCLSEDYSWRLGHGSVQWCYRDIQRRLLVEPLLRDVLGKHPREYRLFVISGSVRFLQVELDPFADHRTATMTPDWDWLHVEMIDPLPDAAPPRPAALDEMIEVAEKLGRPFEDFVRVDMYDLGDRVLVGELTHYPCGGLAPISPREFSRTWASYWPDVD